MSRDKYGMTKRLARLSREDLIIRSGRRVITPDRFAVSWYVCSQLSIYASLQKQNYRKSRAAAVSPRRDKRSRRPFWMSYSHNNYVRMSVSFGFPARRASHDRSRILHPSRPVRHPCPFMATWQDFMGKVAHRVGRYQERTMPSRLFPASHLSLPNLKLCA